ncbi:hypothetical protein PG984_014959 [Apiospora sp. TS-2023a]
MPSSTSDKVTGVRPPAPAPTTLLTTTLLTTTNTTNTTATANTAIVTPRPTDSPTSPIPITWGDLGAGAKGATGIPVRTDSRRRTAPPSLLTGTTTSSAAANPPPTDPPTSSSPIPITWGELGLGAKGATGIPVWVSWLQVFGLIDWALGWLRRVFLATKLGRRFAGWTLLWDHAVLEAAAAAAADPASRVRCAEAFAASARSAADAANMVVVACPAAAPFAAVAAAASDLAAAAATTGDVEVAKTAATILL